MYVKSENKKNTQKGVDSARLQPPSKPKDSQAELLHPSAMLRAESAKYLCKKTPVNSNHAMKPPTCHMSKTKMIHSFPSTFDVFSRKIKPSKRKQQTTGNGNCSSPTVLPSPPLMTLRLMKKILHHLGCLTLRS